MTTDTTGSAPDSVGSTTSTTGGPQPGTTTTTTTTAAPTTTTVDPDPGTSSSSSEGGTFITPPDGGGCVAGFGEHQVRCSYCDPWLQNCPEGQKCVPAGDGHGGWHKTACVPLAPDPAGVGEPCTIEPAPTRLVDDCDSQSICLGSDPQTQEPVCAPLCKGNPEAPECPAGSACVVSNDGVLIPCLPTCDPLENTCPGAQPCRLNPGDPDNFVCFNHPSDGLADQFEPCEDAFDCAPGLSCEDSVFGGECDPDPSERCCLAYCDLDAPSCPLLDDTCAPLFPDDPQSDWAHLGVCRKP